MIKLADALNKIETLPTKDNFTMELDAFEIINKVRKDKQPIKEELPFNGLAESLLKVLNDKLETLTTTEYFIKFSYLLAGKYERTTTRNFRSTDDKTAKEYVDNFSSVFSTAYEAEDKFTLLEWGKVS